MSTFEDAAPPQIRDRLLDGEKLIWWGRPRQGLMFTARDFLVIPFSLMWAGSTVIWEVAAIRTGNTLFVLWGIPFLLLGLFIAFGRFPTDAWIRRHIAYALTDKRVLIARGKPSAVFTSIRLYRIFDLDLVEGSGGRGTVRFGNQAWPAAKGISAGLGFWLPALDPNPQFIGIEEAAKVHAEIQKQARRAEREEA